MSDRTPHHAASAPLALARSALRALGWAWPRILRAALLPYTLSVGIMAVGCPLGIPGRFPFDAAHVALEIAYGAAVARIVAGTGPGARFAGLALPSPAFPGLRPILNIAGAALALLIPALALVTVYMLNAGPWVAAQDAIVLTVVSRITPAFGLTTLIGLVAGANRADREGKTWRLHNKPV